MGALDDTAGQIYADADAAATLATAAAEGGTQIGVDGVRRSIATLLDDDAAVGSRQPRQIIKVGDRLALRNTPGGTSLTGGVFPELTPLTWQERLYKRGTSAHLLDGHPAAIHVDAGVYAVEYNAGFTHDGSPSDPVVIQAAIDWFPAVGEISPGYGKYGTSRTITFPETWPTPFMTVRNVLDVPDGIIVFSQGSSFPLRISSSFGKFCRFCRIA